MMNNIKLPPQKWLGYDPELGEIHGYTFEQMREFAELIVRECAGYVIGAAEVYTQEEQDACERAAVGLKNYFGVSNA